MARTPRRPSKAGVKAAAERAARRSAGEEVVEPVVPLDPPIVPAAEIKKSKAKRSRGRPTLYTPAVGKAVCKMLAMGMSVRKIAQRPRMPKATTIVGWSLDVDHPFFEQFARASAVKFTLMAEELVDIADEGANDWMVREEKSGRISVLVNREALERSRLRLDTRWKILAQALPKFAPKLNIEHTGKDGGPIESRTLPQPTGADHLADIAARYRKPLTVIDGGKKPASGKG